MARGEWVGSCSRLGLVHRHVRCRLQEVCCVRLLNAWSHGSHFQPSKPHHESNTRPQPVTPTTPPPTPHLVRQVAALCARPADLPRQPLLPLPGSMELLPRRKLPLGQLPNLLFERRRLLLVLLPQRLQLLQEFGGGLVWKPAELAGCGV